MQLSAHVERVSVSRMRDFSSHLSYLVTADKYGSHAFTRQLRALGLLKKVDDPISTHSQTKKMQDYLQYCLYIYKGDRKQIGFSGEFVLPGCFQLFFLHVLSIMC